MTDKATTEELARWLDEMHIVSETAAEMGATPCPMYGQAAARLRRLEKKNSITHAMRVEEENEHLREERDQVKAENERLKYALKQWQAENEPLREENEHLINAGDRDDKEIGRLRAAMDQSIDVVFDKLPGPEGCVFIEVEQPPGTSVCMGTWLELEPYAVLRIKASDIASQALEEETP